MLPWLVTSLWPRGLTHAVALIQWDVQAEEVLKGVHETLDKEALRLIKAMPDWKPGKQKGEAVNCIVTFPIHFKINN